MRRAALALCLAVAACSSTGASGDAALVDAAVGDAAVAPDSAPSCAPQAVSRVDVTSAAPLAIAGDTGSTLGVFDPSLLYPAGASAGVMSYSSVPDQASIFTRVAVSSDAGATWSWVADVNQASDVSVPTRDLTVCGASTCAGRLVHEVSSITADPTDDASRLFKLAVHTYVVVPTAQNPLQYAWGHIGLYTAPRPDGPWSAESNAIGWDSTAPTLSSTGASFLVGSVPELADCRVMTEPALVTLPGALDLALGCVSVATGAPTIRVVLLRSTDHALTWRYVGTMLDARDADCLGSVNGQVNAPDLFVVGQHEYLSVSPVIGGGAYDGCAILAVDNPATGQVRRQATTGSPVVLRSIVRSDGKFGGACSYAEGATAPGYVLGAAFLGTTRPFRIFSTGIAGP